ncbi:exported hypothetical protein [Agrobacterium sp. NCPPB 925]|nr:exported hypothetical protein [Agrobacterium sp. NCPPB 925]
MTIRPPSSIFSRVSFLRASDVIAFAIRSSLTSPARIRARRLRRGRLTAASALAGILSPGRNTFASAKLFGDVLEGSLKLCLVNLDIPEAGFQRDATNTLGLAGLGLLQLVLQSGDFFPDPR